MSDRSALQRLVAEAVTAHDQARTDDDPAAAGPADRGLPARRTVIDAWSPPVHDRPADE